MTDQVRAFVDAELQSDLRRMEGIVKATAPGDPNLPCLMAIVESRKAVSGTGTVEQGNAALAKLAAALAAPPRNAELFQVVLIRVVRLASRLGKAGEACRAMRLLDAAGGPRALRPEMEALRSMCHSHVNQLLGDYAGSLNSVTEALKAIGDRRDRLWYMLKAMRVTAAVLMGEVGTAERDLADLESVPAQEGVLLGSLDRLKVQVLSGSCKHEEALAVLDRIVPEEGSPPREDPDARLKILLLAMCLRLDEARELLEKHRGRLTQFHYRFLCGNVAMYEEKWPDARRHLQQALAGPGVRPRDVQTVTERMASLELACRRPGATRALLASIDAGSNDVPMLWCRLFALEGDERKAAGYFRRVLDSGRLETISHQLLCAAELSAHQLARIWKLASAGAGAGSGAADQGGTPPPASVRPEVRREPRPAELIGEAPAMRAVKADIERFAPLDETVLITGETGTGKELTARMLHEAGPRQKLAFTAVNCAAISDTLLESELFGHVKGAFTGAERAHDGLLVSAGGGTIVFDEIGSMSPRLQGALLRVLEERKVRPVGGTRLVPIQARLVAATNQPLEDLVKAGAFRQDLYYRLARLEIRLPPLRERREDILALVRHFLGGFFDGGNIAVGDDLLEELKRHDWPGNVRELANAVQRMVIMAGDAKVLGAGLFRGQVETSAAEA